MFPILFSIPNFSTMPGEARLIEIVIGAVAGLGWLALHFGGKRNWVASALNLAAFLVLLHVALSFVMTDPSGSPKDVTIFSFGVIIILGFFAGASYMVRQTRPLGLPDKKIFDWAFWMLVVGIIGSRILFVYINPEAMEKKWEVFRIWNGGLVWYGGLIPAAIVGIWLLRKYKLPVLQVADVGAAAVVLALGVGRWACLMAGDDYGKVTDAWFGIRFYHPDCLVPIELHGTPLHPTQLYMSMNCLWIFYFVDVVRRRARYAGQAFAWMLILYAITRSTLIEPLRGDFVERTPAYSHRQAAPMLLKKGEDSPAVHLERGAAVSGVDDQGDPRNGRLLSDVDMAAGGGESELFHAISDESVRYNAARRDLWRWNIRSIEGLPDGVIIRPRETTRYKSHLPEPPGYVSTSQWLSIAVVLAGVALLLLVRYLKVDGYAESVALAATEAADGT